MAWLDVARHHAHWPHVDRYNLALLFLALAVIPLFLVSIWLGVGAMVGVYALIARLANKDLDRK